MGIALGWIAIALSGVAASPHPERDRSEQQLTYTVRMVEADGVGWRETVFSSMKPVTRQGCATVWTVPRDCTPRLVAAVCKNATAPLVQAPKVTAFCGAPATIQCRQTRPMVTQVAWNGTENAAQPATEKLRVGWHTTIVGRKLDQGVLVQLVLEDTVVRAVHQVTMKQPAEAKCTSTVGAASAMPQDVRRSRQGGWPVCLCVYDGEVRPSPRRRNPLRATAPSQAHAAKRRSAMPRKRRRSRKSFSKCPRLTPRKWLANG